MREETKETGVKLTGDIKEVTEDLRRHRGLTLWEYIRLKRLESAEKSALEEICRREGI
jgi:hypothetical protein